MSPAVWPLSAGGLLLACFLFALAAYSLRDFSRSRLEEICRLRGRPQRFSDIVRRYEQAILAAELLFAVLFLALTVVVFEWLQIRSVEQARAQGLGTIAAEMAVFLGVVWLATVIVPWCAARVAGERYLDRVWPLLVALILAVRPVLALARRLDALFHRVAGLDEPEETPASALTEEIRSMVDEGERGGVIESEASTMIHRVIELQEEDVSAIMTPRTDMVTLPVDASLEEARRRFLEAGHSRIPVVGETTDDVVGILYAKDLLRHLTGEPGRPPHLREIVREPMYVPETTGIDTLLATMKRDRVHFAIVIDEYGGVSGLVTMEDILEQIVGAIDDEFDAAEEAGVTSIQPGVFEAASWVHIDELNEQFGLDLPEDDDYDTIGGFVFSQLGRIPRPGETFNWRQLRVTVLEADKRKIDRLRIEVDQTLAAASAEEP